MRPARLLQTGCQDTPGTLDGHLGAALGDQPSREAPHSIGHGGKHAALLLVLVHEARHDRLGRHVEAPATLGPALQRVRLAATACALGSRQSLRGVRTLAGATMGGASTSTQGTRTHGLVAPRFLDLCTARPSPSRLPLV